ncbi:hydrogen peroxide-inducible genes activator [Agrobacterium sp. BA1120]|uniref:hydrogen peroxide-inducible genes activator n=1 Tax=Agrobacterium sp. BA1120 TaxID=3228927 RepID=UPI000DE0B180
MKNLTLKQLRYFEALARHRRFRLAADACAISQPALSMQIKELEEDVGHELFERSAREIRLTGFGQTFAIRVREILRAVDELDELARVSKNSFLSRLRIGIIPTVAPYLLPTIINDLNKAFEGIEIQVRETQTARLIEELKQGDLDLAIVALPISEPALTELKLFDEEFVLVRRHEDGGKPVPERTALPKMRLLLLEEGHCFRDQALSFCNVGSSQPREVMEGSSLSTLVQMVSAGIGITLIPEMAVPMETRSAHVSISHFEAPAPVRSIGMIWRNASPLIKQLMPISEVIRGSSEKMRALSVAS